MYLEEEMNGIWLVSSVEHDISQIHYGISEYDDSFSFKIDFKSNLTSKHSYICKDLCFLHFNNYLLHHSNFNILILFLFITLVQSRMFLFC